MSALSETQLIARTSHSYFTQIEQMLRRSLGVSQTAQAEVDVKPAPPVETGPVRPAAPSPEETFGGMGGDFPDWADIKDKVKDMAPDLDIKTGDEAEDAIAHDEL